MFYIKLRQRSNFQRVKNSLEAAGLQEGELQEEKLQEEELQEWELQEGELQEGEEDCGIQEWELHLSLPRPDNCVIRQYSDHSLIVGRIW